MRIQSYQRIPHSRHSTGWNIAFYAPPTVRNSVLQKFCFPGSFSCVFSRFSWNNVTCARDTVVLLKQYDLWQGHCVGLVLWWYSFSPGSLSLISWRHSHTFRKLYITIDEIRVFNSETLDLSGFCLFLFLKFLNLCPLYFFWFIYCVSYNLYRFTGR